MLQEPMMEKRTAMRLLGIEDALKAQQQHSAARKLSFMERLGLLVDQQLTWRENQALRGVCTSPSTEVPQWKASTTGPLADLTRA